MTIGSEKTSTTGPRSDGRLLSTLLHLTDVGVLVTDRDGMILRVNVAFQSFTDDEWMDLEGEHVGIWLAELDDQSRAKWDTLVRQVANQGIARRLSFIKQGPDEALTFEVSATMLTGADGEWSGEILSLWRDTTDQTAMEELLQKAQRNDLLSVLSSGIAHDFNNILTTLMGNLTMAKWHAEHNSEVLVRLLAAEESLKQAKGLTGQLISFAKGGVPFHRTTGLSDVIRDTTEFTLRAADVQRQINIQPELWAVEINEGQISQVLQNLILNAVQAIETQGFVVVTAKNVKITEGGPLPVGGGSYVRITVSDTGVGIPEEHLDKLFDPYFTTKQDATGLGLATCYSIIKQHSGAITVDSDLGRGSTFTIYLPAFPESTKRKRHSSMKYALPGNGRILVMDDDLNLLKVLEDFLLQLGYDAGTAQNGKEAIQLYVQAAEANVPYEVVILDLSIPGGMGGVETLRHLREYDPTVKGVLTTGYTGDPALVNYKNFGFQSAIAKPFNIESLSGVLYEVLRGIDRDV